jgi:hypothetical protein
MMRTENVLWWLTTGCATLLLFGPSAGRTTWIRQGGGVVKDAAGYDWLALCSGIVAIVSLTVGLWARPRVLLPVLGAAAAVVAFLLTAVASGSYWMAILRGDVTHNGIVLPASEGWTVYPASGPPFFAVIATIGTAFALGLTVYWLTPAEDEA